VPDNIWLDPMFTLELKVARLHIKIARNSNPAVRTRKDEVVS